MITQEEHNQIVMDVLEKILLKMPELIGNLMKHHAYMHELNQKFYKKYPEFKSHTKTVQSVLEKFESENTFMDYNMLIEKAAPEIKRRIQLTSKLNFDTIKYPNLDDYLQENNNGLI